MYNLYNSNDDQDARDLFGYAHVWAIHKAFWICSQLGIDTKRIRIKSAVSKAYRRLTAAEEAYVKLPIPNER